MNKDFLKRSVIIPLITALAVGAIFSAAVFSEADKLLPFASGSVIADFDDTDPDKQPVKTDAADFSLKRLNANTVFGTLHSGAELPLRYDADYSRLIDSASLLPCSNAPTELGSVYIMIGANQRSVLDTKKPLTVSGDFGEVHYAFEESFTAESEEAVFLHTVRGERSLIVFYHIPAEAGVKRACKAFVFKGVL